MAHCISHELLKWEDFWSMEQRFQRIPVDSVPCWVIFGCCVWIIHPGPLIQFWIQSWEIWISIFLPVHVFCYFQTSQHRNFSICWQCALLGGLLPVVFTNHSEIPVLPSPFISLQQILSYLTSELSTFTAQNLISNTINQKNTLVAL